MAGTNPQVNISEVRQAIQFAMRMGSPNRLEDKATFYFRQTRVWRDPSTASPDEPDGEVVVSPRLDQDGNPFNPDLKLHLEGKAPVVLDEVAVEFAIARPEELEVGSIRPTRVEITILDEQWRGISDAIEVSLQSGDRYYISYEKPVIGLFEMDVHQLVCYAKDES